ncbi:L-serine ammonia-lyase [Methylomarinum vadi]|uniref:L-serine ammonia-lyase n=1 Tax=Methylomarinum vadi TaxID=438855 RepID=UPI0004DFAE0B|nr:L-serine ammonia-lyase [Methylomarinum vadi]
MAISVFDIFKIGIGPSSSHTVGPMRAARLFAELLLQEYGAEEITRLRIELFGSLGATGKGHGTDKAVLLGLQGELPDQIDPDTIPDKLDAIRQHKQLLLLNRLPVAFKESRDLIFRLEALPFHANGMRFSAFSGYRLLAAKEYYSTGGGFITTGEEDPQQNDNDEDNCLPYPFNTSDELLKLCMLHKCSISTIMLNNEKAWLSEGEIRQGLLNIWSVMQACAQRGITQEGILPGGLNVKRRAADLYKQLHYEQQRTEAPLNQLDWVDMYAIAVNEENAAGGRVVTAPTNGAAGIIPAVLHYYMRFCRNANEEGVIRFLLTAGALAILYKKNASISGAEVGCQGEVGVACSMAAGALAEVMGGSPEQVENAAEIGMEHNLGLTCDPIGGLVQIPCIERNAMGAVKAINAARMALRGSGTHLVSLDKVIKTMRETGADMQSKYKETSQGGLAVNVTEC